MKKFRLVITIVLFVVMAFSLVACKKGNSEELTMEETSMPAYENTFTFMPDTLPTDQTELIRLAAQMYATANQNTQAMQSAAFLVKYNSNIKINLGVATMEIPVQGYRYQLKTGTEFYSTEYAIPGEEGLGSLAGMFSKESSDFASRSYADVTKANYMFSEKSYSPTISKDPETNEVRIESNFSDKNLVSASKWSPEQPLPYYCSAQEEPFYAANRSMTENNILSATIEYCKSLSGNYYRLQLELDVDKEETWERTIEELRSGAGEDAKYTKMTEIIEIWENGYYKSFRSLDHTWSKKGTMTMEFDYNTYYYYDAEHTVPSYYQNFSEAKEKALAYFEENKQ